MIKRSKICCFIAAFVIPICLLCIVYAGIGIFPFGDKTLFTNDMSYEYAAIFAYFGELLRGNGDWLYTFSKAIGGDMAGIFGYYILSPFNLLVVFFKPEQMPIFVFLITVLKIGTAGLTMNMYLNHRYLRSISCLFSTAYALMAYNIAYQQNIMWLDGVILLPLVVWGIDRIMAGKRYHLYLLSLAAGLITNFYIGYMLCVFSVLYFGFHFLCFWNRKEGKPKCKPVLQFFYGSLLAGGIAAVSLIPVFFSLTGGKSEIYLGRLLHFQLQYKPLEVLKNLLPGQFDIQGGTFKSPNIYCGLFILVFVFYYLVKRTAEKREKTANLLILIFLYLSLMFKNFEMAWHGLELPTGYPHRFSFLFSFVLIGMAYKGWMLLDETDFIHKFSRVKILCVVVCIWSAAELTVNAGLLLNRFQYVEVSDYRLAMEKDYRVVKEIQGRDDGFNRMEDSHGGFSMNNPMLMQYRGLASSYSGEKLSTKVLAGNLGLNEKATWIAYHDQMSVGMESLLNLKYIMTGGNDRDYYKLLKKEGNLHIYANPYVLPFGTLTDKTILEANIENRDMFAIQNEVWNSVLRTQEQLYLPVPAQELYRGDDGVTYELKVENEMVIYTSFFNEGFVETCDIYVNGRIQNTFAPEKMPYRLGRFKKGDILKIDIRSEENNINWYDLYFYYENIPVLDNHIERIREEAFRISRFNEHHFEGTISNHSGAERFALFTIPYERGWRISLDGKNVIPDKALNSLICINIPQGTHELTMYFLPQGLIVGGCISFFSLLFLLIAYKKQKNDSRRIMLIGG